MRPFVAGHAVLLAVALAAAWWASTREEKKRGKDDVVVLADLDAKTLSKIAYVYPKGTTDVTVKRAGDAVDLTVAVARTVEAKPKKKKKGADAGVDDVDAGPEPEEREESVFKGGRTVGKAVEALAPLTARRSLGVVDDERLATMGLKDPQRRITIEAGGKTTVVEVGEPTYGGQGRYARVAGKPDVALLESAVVSGLEGGASQLMERKVFDAPPEDVLGLVVSVGARSVKFLHVDKDQPATRRWARADDPASDVDAAASFVSTLRGLRATAYPTEAAVVDAAPLGAFEVDVVKGEDVRGTILTKPDGGATYVKIGAWIVEVSAAQGKELVEDLRAAAQE